MYFSRESISALQLAEVICVVASSRKSSGTAMSLSVSSTLGASHCVEHPMVCVHPVTRHGHRREGLQVSCTASWASIRTEDAGLWAILCMIS